MVRSNVPVVEVELALRALDDEGARPFLLHDAGVHEVAHEECSILVHRRLLLELCCYLLGLHQLVLDLLDSGPGGSVRVLLRQLRLLVLLDLLLRPSPLAADLDHVGGDAVVLYAT